MAEVATRNLPSAPAAEWIRTMQPAVRFILHGNAQVRALAAPAWGVPFSEEACRAKEQGSRATLWHGPNEYLLLGGDAESEFAVGDELERALKSVPHALVNVSHRQFAIEVSGPHAATIINGACPLDLDLSEFPIGMCTRTLLAKADIVLWRTREDAFHLEIWRSFQGYVSGLLQELAREFYP